MKPTAVVGRRVAAFILDGLLIGAINAALFFALATKFEGTSGVLERLESGEVSGDTTLYGNLAFGDTTYAVHGGKAALFVLLTLLITIGYWVMLQGVRGFTLGKLMLGIRVVRDDGAVPGVGRAFARWFLFIVDGFPYLIPYLTGFIVMLANGRNKRVGDIVAGTLVVKKDAVGVSQLTEAEAAPTWITGSPARSEPAPDPAPAPAPPPTPAAADNQPAGWYPDPKGEKRLRYWDGSAWTDHTAD